jgi:Spy/CpxP family protein refolding chaperone
MKKLVLTIVLSALAAATVASAQVSASAPAPAVGTSAAPTVSAAPPAASPAGMVIDRILAPLGLRTEQQALVATLRQQFESATTGLRADLRARTAELRRLRQAAGADPANLQTKREELTALQATLRGEADKLAVKISAVLDPEQRARFEAALNAIQSSRPEGERRPAPGTPSTAPAAQPASPPPAGG